MEDNADIQFFGSSDLCFDKEIFMRADFNVDDFMRQYQCSGEANMETLRDHLGVYLKILRSAMIDLINRDYADFVNLSTNLTGLDGLIQALTVPLGQLKEEVLSVSKILENASSGVLADLEKQNIIEKYKRKLTTLSDIAKRLDNLEELLRHGVFENEPKSDAAPQTNNDQNDGDKSVVHDNGEEALGNLCLEVCTQEELLDRFASELSYLNYLSSTCEGTHLISIYKPRIKRLQSAVEAGIERNLKTCLGATDAGVPPSAAGAQQGSPATLLRRTLIAAAVMDATEMAEEVVREILAPKIKEVLSEPSFSSAPRGLAGILAAVITLLTGTCGPLLQLTLPRRHAHTASVEEVPGFQFLERSLFPEVVSAMTALPDLCSPANPTAFHQRYLQCLDFLTSFEELLVTKARVDAFRSMETYQKFLELWNLPVYFQIRNQEIGQVVESSLCEEAGLRLYSWDSLPRSAQGANCAPKDTQEGEKAAKEDSNSTVVETVSSNNTDQQRVLSSTRGVLRGIYQCWQHEVYLPPLLHRFWKLTLLILSRHRTWLTDTLDNIKDGSALVPAVPLRAGGAGGAHHRPPSTVHLTAHLLADVSLLDTCLSSLYATAVVEHVTHLPQRHRDVITTALSSEVASLQSFCGRLLSLLTREVAGAMCAAMSPITDTPRRYRRTNRSAPTLPQPYVGQVLAPLQQLHSSDTLPHCHRTHCYTAITASVAAQFYTLTSEVLGNVSKTEESLRRLKRARGNSAVVTSQQGAGLTDEDKIREQLHIDVEHLGQELRLLGVVTERVQQYQQLAETVRQARTASGVTS